MYPPEALEFFRDLAENQNKTWFDAQKSRYERSVREPMGAMILVLSDRLAKAGLPLRGDPKRSMFRLNRDVRFSANKSPYKTAAGCVFSRTGEKNSPGILYFHLDPKGTFTAAGFYRPDPDALHRMRLGLVREPKPWAKIVKTLAAAGLELDGNDALVRVPRGFESAPPELHQVLRFKSWVIKHAIPPAELIAATLVDHLVEFALTAAPLLKFGWAALDRIE